MKTFNVQGFELKGCPFCGGEPEIERLGTARVSMKINCTNCGCYTESGDRHEFKCQNWHWNYRFDSEKDVDI